MPAGLLGDGDVDWRAVSRAAPTTRISASLTVSVDTLAAGVRRWAMDTRRRSFLGGAAAGAALLSVGSGTRPTPELAERGEAGEAPRPSPTDDPRVEELIQLSRAKNGSIHVGRVAFVTEDGVSGTLPIEPGEIDDLRATLASGDFTSFQQRGLRVGGHKFVFIREMEDGAVVHAVRRGEFVTVRATTGPLIVATSLDGMAHPRAVEAVYQYARRHGLLVERADLDA